MLDKVHLGWWLLRALKLGESAALTKDGQTCVAELGSRLHWSELGCQDQDVGLHLVLH